MVRLIKTCKISVLPFYIISESNIVNEKFEVTKSIELDFKV